MQIPNPSLQSAFDQLLSMALKDEWDAFSRALAKNPNLARFRDQFDSTLLMKIVCFAPLYILDQLIRLGADINAVDLEGQNAIYTLIDDDVSDLDRVKWFINNGGDIELIGFNGRRPLHIAALRNECAIANFLITSGANINARDGHDDSETPLMMAARANNVEMVELLLNSGADPSLKNRWGRVARDFSPFICGGRIRKILNASG